ncbi:hypothetical protein [Sorangium cellulosum]|uniref:Uncharacterized protein n=1 Tax=Sorangium cellulosum TaxID=56 RepID=A0A150QNH0_SORCE|nr:hypothetical protein [Sorangium cellulosum]KYF69382.1 hypothetical protein BE15_31490 [Sorangium cellulosum]
MAAGTRPAAEAQEASEGLSLAQVAAVRAALAEGFPLADVLAVEGLKPRAFAHADLAWKQRLVAEPELLATYRQELAHAEDWLERSIDPLAEDATAWASFLAAFEAHAAPFELLKQKDLGMNDVARLRRRWARRAEEDATVGELLLKLRAEPEELRPFRVGPRVLRPSRVAEARGPAMAPTREPTAAIRPEPGLGLAEYAALCAELAALPEQRERVLRRHGLSDEAALARLHGRWREALERDAARAKDFERLEAHHARRLEMLLARARAMTDAERSTAPLAASSVPYAPPSGGVIAPGALQGTGPLPHVPRGAVVPFVPAQGELTTVRAEPKPPRATDSLTGTAPLPDIPQRAALPFPRSSAPAAWRPSPQPPAELGETSLSLEIPRELLRHTASGQAAMPEATSRSSNVSPPPSPPIKTTRDVPAPLSEPLETILPLAQYAALCAELALFPEAAEAVFQRHGLGSSEMRSAIDTAWKERLRDHPTEYATWQDMYRRYHAHFVKRGAPAG